jgi:SAM-dependent methyltransferase
MPAVVTTQDAVNARVYHAEDVTREYRSDTLTRAEAMVLLRHHDAFAGRDVLDIGVGTGRTSVYLAPLAARYEAIDYSPVMVAHVRRHLPGVPVRLADMRDLSAFSSASFDFVFASNNVIDAVDGEGRLRTFLEVNRVLRGGGWFVFSSHNRHWTEALRPPHPAWSPNPAREVLNLARWLRQVGNHARIASLREVFSEHALLNDGGHDYACLHYYTSQRHARAQALETGFEVAEVLDALGTPVAADDQAPDSPWLMFAARKLPPL